MSIFGKMKDAIFGHKAQAATPARPQATQARQSGNAGLGQQQVQPAQTQPAPAQSIAVDQVDVEANLAELGQGKNLNWRTSIVDLMKLLGIDSSLQNRKELAQELGYTGELNGSAEMNIWLHKATMKELAANGGKVPAELLD